MPLPPQPPDREVAPAPREREVAPAPAPPGQGLLREVLLVFAGVTAAASLLYHLQGPVPFIRQNLHGLIAALFLLVPTELLVRRRESFEAHGLCHRPLGRGLLLFAAAAAVVFPLFGVGFYVYYRQVCAAGEAGAALPEQIRNLCLRFEPRWQRVRLRASSDLWMQALTQLLVVALPEEYFFRGYMQTRLGRVWPPRRRVLGAPAGRALLASAALFALGHLLVDFNPLRLSVFFPGLAFGWMRELGGSILAPVLFHTASNLVSKILHASFMNG